jgi:hypothetical protein
LPRNSYASCKTQLRVTAFAFVFLGRNVPQPVLIVNTEYLFSSSDLGHLNAKTVPQFALIPGSSAAQSKCVMTQ